jgi:starch phosphorylase
MAPTRGDFVTQAPTTAAMPFAVRSLPTELAPMLDLALDLRWSWRPEIRELFAHLASDDEAMPLDPWRALRTATERRLSELSRDRAFLAELDRLVGERQAYLADGAWYEQTHGRATEPLVAYFSMEIGLDEALPLYSGGLGVLAGDHLKSASALGVPLVGVSLLYGEGYFRQQLDAAGWQREHYPANRLDLLPVAEVRGPDGRQLTVDVPFPGRAVRLAVWEVLVGRVRLYLLDANVAENSPADRGITAQLYGGDLETRLQQELVLGIGGWRALMALGLRPPVLHLNEGHAAFAVLERARAWMVEQGSTYEVARAATAAGNLFTTHTPVGAGFDVFPADLARRYLGSYAGELEVDVEALIDLGRPEAGDRGRPLEMAVLALRSSGAANGVSRLHGEVSRRLFAPLFPRRPLGEVPVGSVTNGVHVASWVSDEMRSLWQSCAGEGCWDRPDTADWGEIENVADETLWDARQRERRRLVEWARARLATHLGQRAASPERIAAAAETLDPAALTIGFARRFAEYKRPTLLFSQPDRLRRLLGDPDRPVQLVLAGKAHPRDDGGKALIEQVARFAEDPDVRSRIVFLEDYDLEHAAHLVQGVDVWLNTPRYPLEASGTSGMKVLVNGGLNLSELDGWWAEAYDPSVGWTMAATAEHDGEHASDAEEVERLYRVLEEEVVPLFYDRDATGLPRGWIARMRTSMARLTPRFSASRMVSEYLERFYLPAAGRFAALDDPDAAGRHLAWKARLREGWSDVAVGPTETRPGSRGTDVAAPVRLGSIRPDDVSVELYRDPRPDEDPGTGIVPLRPNQPGPDGWRSYQGGLPSDGALDAYTVRVVPRDPGTGVPLDLPLIAWQR